MTTLSDTAIEKVNRQYGPPPAPGFPYTGAAVYEILECAKKHGRINQVMTGSTLIILSGIKVRGLEFTWVGKSYRVYAVTKGTQAGLCIYDTQEGVLVPGPWLTALVKYLQDTEKQNRLDNNAAERKAKNDADDKAKAETDRIDTIAKAWVKEWGT